jgi:hypothetical protein
MHWAEDIDWSKHDEIRDGCFIPQEIWAKMTPEERKAFAYAYDPLPRRIFPKLITKDLIGFKKEDEG